MTLNLRKRGVCPDSGSLTAPGAQYCPDHRPPREKPPKQPDPGDKPPKQPKTRPSGPAAPEMAVVASLDEQRESVAAACRSGDERRLLAALRAKLAEAITDPATPAKDLSPLTRRLTEIDRTLRDLDQRREAERSAKNIGGASFDITSI